jgi:hypothetical protein
LTNRGRQLIDAALQDHLEAKPRSSTGIDSTDAESCIDLLWTLTGRLRDWRLAQTATD